MSPALRAGSVVWLAGSALAIAVGGCTSRVQSDPATFEVRQDAVPRMRAPQGIAVMNAYDLPALVVAARRGNSRIVIDLKDFTGTAVGMLERRMRRDGIDVVPEAGKSIIVRVRDVSVLSDGFAALSTITMEAELGNGAKRTLRIKNNSTTAGRALDGALVTGITQLLNDREFLDYVNGQ